MRLKRNVDMHTPVEWAGPADSIFECTDGELAQRLVKFRYCSPAPHEDVTPIPEPEDEPDAELDAGFTMTLPSVDVDLGEDDEDE